MPTDVYVIGCPPRPENLFYALLKLQDKIDQMTLAKRPTEVRLAREHGREFQAPGHDRADAAAEIEDQHLAISSQHSVKPPDC